VFTSVIIRRFGVLALEGWHEAWQLSPR